MSTLSTVTTGLGKFWAWLKKNPIVLWLLVGALVGALAVGWWDRRHPQVKTVVDTTSVKNIQDRLNLEIQKSASLTQDLATAQNQIINLQSSKKVVTHVDKKPNGEVITDTTFEQEMKESKNTQTNTTEQKVATTTTNVDETKLHNEVDTTHTVTTTTPMVAPRLLINGEGGAQFSGGIKPVWQAGAAVHAGSIFEQDIYTGCHYISVNNTVTCGISLGLFH